MATLTYNTELIFQSQDDFRLILDVLESQKRAFNEASKIHFEEDKGHRNNIVELHGKFYKQFREKNQKIPAQIVIRAEQECLSNYRSTKSNKHKIDKAIEKKGLSMRLDQRLYSYKNGKFKLTTLNKRIWVDFNKYSRLTEILKNYKFCDPLIFFRDGKIWICLSFKIETKPEALDKLALGIDLGVNRAIATSEGKIYIDKKFNKEKRKLRYLKRQLQSCIHTKKSKSARKHLKKLKHKERNKNKNQTHLLVNYITRDTKANTLILEDLTGLKSPKQKRSKSNNNKIGQVPLYQFKQILTYKAPLYGKTVMLINPKFTSQIDSRTGLKDGLRKGSRYYCSDGQILDADINASINIAKRSKLPVSLRSNSGFETYGQALVIVPNVGNTLGRKT
jgi:IS605 OrfB family transposase